MIYPLTGQLYVLCDPWDSSDYNALTEKVYYCCSNLVYQLVVHVLLSQDENLKEPIPDHLVKAELKAWRFVDINDKNELTPQRSSESSGIHALLTMECLIQGCLPKIHQAIIEGPRIWIKLMESLLLGLPLLQPEPQSVYPREFITLYGTDAQKEQYPSLHINAIGKNASIEEQTDFDLDGSRAADKKYVNSHFNLEDLIAQVEV